MYGLHKKEPAITILERKDITLYVRAFRLHMRRQGRVFDTRQEATVKYMVELMNEPENTTFKSTRGLQSDRCYWDYQRVDYMSSNLHRGFIFYFRCNGCGDRVKYLYEYSMVEAPLCRICCRLKYRQPGRKERTLTRIFRKPYFSGEDRYWIIKGAGITLEDIKASLE